MAWDMPAYDSISGDRRAELGQVVPDFVRLLEVQSSGWRQWHAF